MAEDFNEIIKLQVDLGGAISTLRQFESQMKDMLGRLSKASDEIGPSDSKFKKLDKSVVSLKSVIGEAISAVTGFVGPVTKVLSELNNAFANIANTVEQGTAKAKATTTSKKTKKTLGETSSDAAVKETAKQQKAITDEVVKGQDAQAVATVEGQANQLKAVEDGGVKKARARKKGVEEELKVTQEGGKKLVASEEKNAAELLRVRREAFEKLATAQRGAPETLMLRAANAAGGGFIQPVLEHTGDLINRMTQSGAERSRNYEVVSEKVRKALRYLDNASVSFEKEFKSNLANNAKAAKIPLEIYTEKVGKALNAYSQAHAELPVYNKVQELARTAAVSLGKQSFDEARKALRELKGILDKGEAVWKEEADKFDANYGKAIQSSVPKGTAAKTQKELTAIVKTGEAEQVKEVVAGEEKKTTARKAGAKAGVKAIEDGTKTAVAAIKEGVKEQSKTLDAASDAEAKKTQTRGIKIFKATGQKLAMGPAGDTSFKVIADNFQKYADDTAPRINKANELINKGFKGYKDSALSVDYLKNSIKAAEKAQSAFNKLEEVYVLKRKDIRAYERDPGDKDARAAYTAAKLQIGKAADAFETANKASLEMHNNIIKAEEATVKSGARLNEVIGAVKTELQKSQEVVTSSRNFAKTRAADPLKEMAGISGQKAKVYVEDLTGQLKLLEKEAKNLTGGKLNTLDIEARVKEALNVLGGVKGKVDPMIQQMDRLKEAYGAGKISQLNKEAQSLTVSRLGSKKLEVAAGAEQPLQLQVQTKQVLPTLEELQARLEKLKQTQKGIKETTGPLSAQSIKNNIAQVKELIRLMEELGRRAGVVSAQAAKLDIKLDKPAIEGLKSELNGLLAQIEAKNRTSAQGTEAIQRRTDALTRKSEAQLQADLESARKKKEAEEDKSEEKRRKKLEDRQKLELEMGQGRAVAVEKARVSEDIAFKKAADARTAYNKAEVEAEKLIEQGTSLTVRELLRKKLEFYRQYYSKVQEMAVEAAKYRSNLEGGTGPVDYETSAKYKANQATLGKGISESLESVRKLDKQILIQTEKDNAERVLAVQQNMDAETAYYKTAGETRLLMQKQFDKLVQMEKAGASAIELGIERDKFNNLKFLYEKNLELAKLTFERRKFLEQGVAMPTAPEVGAHGRSVVAITPEAPKEGTQIGAVDVALKAAEEAAAKTKDIIKGVDNSSVNSAVNAGKQRSKALIDAETKVTVAQRLAVDARAQYQELEIKREEAIQNGASSQIIEQMDRQLAAAKRYYTGREMLVELFSKRRQLLESKAAPENVAYNDELIKRWVSDTQHAYNNIRNIGEGISALEARGNPISRMFRAWKTNTFEMMGRIVEFQVFWGLAQGAIDAVLFPFRAMINLFKEGVEFAKEMQDRIVDVREVLLQNARFSYATAENFQLSTEAAEKFVNIQLELAAKSGVAYEKLQSVFESFAQSGGLKGVGADLEKAAKASALMVVGLGSVGVSTKDTRRAIQEIRKLLEGTVTPRDKIVQLFKISSQELNRQSLAAQAQGKFFEFIEEKLKAQNIRLDTALDRYSTMSALISLIRKQIAAAFASEILKPWTEMLKDIYEWLSKNRTAVSGLFSAMGYAIGNVITILNSLMRIVSNVNMEWDLFYGQSVGNPADSPMLKFVKMLSLAIVEVTYQITALVLKVDELVVKARAWSEKGIIGNALSAAGFASPFTEQVKRLFSEQEALENSFQTKQKENTDKVIELETRKADSVSKVQKKALSEKISITEKSLNIAEQALKEEQRLTKEKEKLLGPRSPMGIISALGRAAVTPIKDLVKPAVVDEKQLVDLDTIQKSINAQKDVINRYAISATVPAETIQSIELSNRKIESLEKSLADKRIALKKNVTKATKAEIELQIAQMEQQKRAEEVSVNALTQSMVAGDKTPSVEKVKTLKEQYQKLLDSRKQMDRDATSSGKVELDKQLKNTKEAILKTDNAFTTQNKEIATKLEGWKGSKFPGVIEQFALNDIKKRGQFAIKNLEEVRKKILSENNKIPPFTPIGEREKGEIRDIMGELREAIAEVRSKFSDMVEESRTFASERLISVEKSSTDIIDMYRREYEAQVSLMRWAKAEINADRDMEEKTRIKNLHAIGVMEAQATIEYTKKTWSERRRLINLAWEDELKVSKGKLDNLSQILENANEHDRDLVGKGFMYESDAIQNEIDRENILFDAQTDYIRKQYDDARENNQKMIEIFYEDQRMTLDHNQRIAVLNRQRTDALRDENLKRLSYMADYLAAQEKILQAEINLQNAGTYTTDQKKLNDAYALSEARLAAAEATEKLREAEAQRAVEFAEKNPENLVAKESARQATLAVTGAKVDVQEAKAVTITTKNQMKLTKGLISQIFGTDVLTLTDVFKKLREGGTEAADALSSMKNVITEWMSAWKSGTGSGISFTSQMLGGLGKSLVSGAGGIGNAISKLFGGGKGGPGAGVGIDEANFGVDLGGSTSGLAEGLGGAFSKVAGKLGSIMGVAGPIGQAVGAVIQLFSALWGRAAKRIANQMKTDFQNILKDFDAGSRTLGQTVMDLQQKRMEAIMKLSGKKGGQKQLDELLPEFDQEIASLIKQQKEVQKTFQDELRALRLGSGSLADFATKWDEILKKVKDYKDSFSAADLVITPQVDLEAMQAQLGSPGDTTDSTAYGRLYLAQRAMGEAARNTPNIGDVYRQGGDPLKPYKDDITAARKEVEDLSGAIGKANTALNVQGDTAEFVSRSLKKLKIDFQEELTSAEQEAIQNALDLNDLIKQRTDLIEEGVQAQKDFNKQLYDLQSADALERRTAGSVTRALELQDAITQYNKDKQARDEQMADLERQITLKSTIVAMESAVFTISSDTATLRERSDQLTITSLGVQIEKWKEIKGIVNGITEDSNGIFSISPDLAKLLQGGVLGGTTNNITNNSTNTYNFTINTQGGVTQQDTQEIYNYIVNSGRQNPYSSTGVRTR
jgi:hypothetical protein